MATVIENIEVKCRNVEEYYDLLKDYKYNGYEIIEHDGPDLNFFAKRNRKIWELD